LVKENWLGHGEENKLMRAHVARLVLTRLLGLATFVFADVKTIQLPVVAMIELA
jgi:hypothetical protein